LSAVLTAGNTAVNTITLQDATNPATLYTQMTDTGFFSTDATGSPQYDSSVSANNITVSSTNGDSTTLTANTMNILTTTYSNTIDPTQMIIDDLTVGTSTTFTGNSITINNPTTVFGYVITNNMPPSSGEGYTKIEMSSGNLTTTPPRLILEAFVDFNAPPSYAPNINLIDMGGVNGEELLISNGNNDSGLGLAYNTIQLFSDSVVNNSFIQLKSVDASTSAGSTLYLGQNQFSLSVTNQTAFSIASGFTDPIVIRRNISTTTNSGMGHAVGMLENSIILTTPTTGTTTLTIATNAFSTLINTPTIAGRIIILPTITIGTDGYWYGICNKSTLQTIAVQYPGGTTIATIPVAPSATNGGSVARFAVVSGGTSYFRVN
jgi:hypothetical protein